MPDQPRARASRLWSKPKKAKSNSSCWLWPAIQALTRRSREETKENSMRVLKVVCYFLFVSAITAAGVAQEKGPAAPSAQSAEKIPEVAHYFRLEFVIQE